MIGEWTECSKFCKSTRLRSCTDPEPKYGGKDCEGSIEDLRYCLDGKCQHNNDCFTMKNYEYNDLKQIPLQGMNDSLTECQNLCQENVNCQNFVIGSSSYPIELCYLKNGIAKQGQEGSSHLGGLLIIYQIVVELNLFDSKHAMRKRSYN